MSTLILPCAGKSTRFKNTRPKWSLTHPYGELMLIQGIKGLELEKYDVVIPVFLKEHLDEFDLREGINKSFKNLGVKFEILELSTPTKSQSETVAKAIEHFNIKGNILIKDCDDYFTSSYVKDNVVCVSSLHDVEKIIADDMETRKLDLMQTGWSSVFDWVQEGPNKEFYDTKVIGRMLQMLELRKEIDKLNSLIIQ